MIDLSVRRDLRKIAGAHRSMPVDVIPGDSAPAVTGRPHHWITPGGRPVHFPSAYRRAFGKPVYVSSSLSVEVGVEWLANRYPKFAAQLQLGAGI